MNETLPIDVARRRLLGLGAGFVAAATRLPAEARTQPVAQPEPPARDTHATYRVTGHIRTYYRLADF